MKISLEELNELLKQLKISQKDFSASVASAQDKAQAISDSHAMRGLTKGAINAEIENYKIPLLLQYNDIDDALIADFEKAINDFKSTTSETSASAVIYESSLTTLEQKIAPIKSEYDLLVAKINHTQSTVGDLVSLTPLRSSGVSDGLEASKRILTKLKQDMRSFNSKKEYSTTKSLLAEQKSALKTVGKALSGGFDDNSSIKTFNDTEYLYKVLDKSKTFNKQVEKRYGKSKYWKIIQEYGGIKNVNRLGYLIMQMQKINKNIQDDISPYTMTLKKFEDAMGFMKGFYDKIAKKNGKGKLIQALDIEWRKLSKKKGFQNLLHNGFITHSFNGTLTQWSKISYKNKAIFNKFYSKLPDKYFGKFKKVMSKLGNSKVGKGVVNLLENAQHNERLLEAMKKGAKVREKGVAIFEVLDKVTKPEELVKDLGEKYFERLTKAPETKREIAAEIRRLTKSNAHVSSLKKYTLKKSYKFYGKVGRALSRDAGYKGLGMATKGLKAVSRHAGAVGTGLTASYEVFKGFMDKDNKDTYHNVGKAAVHAATDTVRNFGATDGAFIGGQLGFMVGGPVGAIIGGVAGAGVGVGAHILSSGIGKKWIDKTEKKAYKGIDSINRSISNIGNGLKRAFSF